MINIAGTHFDHVIGQVLKPEPDAIPFRSSTSQQIGIQRTAERGPGFTLTVTRYDAAIDMEWSKLLVTQQVGNFVRIINYYEGLTVDYLHPIHGEYYFAVSQARVIEARNIPGWCGYRLDSTPIKYEPAAKVVSQWTMYAVKA